MPASEVVIDYTNWRGERAGRRILPLDLVFQATEWHPKEQWLLRAIDVEKGDERLFAVADIHSWAQSK